jgi:hypothetical protein
MLRNHPFEALRSYRLRYFRRGCLQSFRKHHRLRRSGHDFRLELFPPFLQWLILKASSCEG